VAIFIRTDAPAAPGTATPSTTSITIPTTATGVSTTIYPSGTGTIDPGTEVVVLSLSVSLTKRSLVVAVFNCFANAYATLRLYIGGVLVAGQVVEVTRMRLLTLHGYRTLSPGTYSVEVRAYNHTTGIGGMTCGAETTGVPACSLVVYAVPLE
jgi:hypothetical protein